MKRTIGALVATAALLFSALNLSAEEQTTWGALKNLTGQAPLAAAKAANQDVTSIFLFNDPGTQVPGASSTLHRSPNGVTINIKTSQLEPGDAVTVWWVIFNNPEECIDGCNGPDLGVPAVEASALYTAGNVIGGNGKGNFSGHLQEGDTTGALFGPGLIDSQKAEIHMIVRTHGAAIPGLIPEQIQTFGGGCEINTCSDVQFSVHLP